MKWKRNITIVSRIPEIYYVVDNKGIVYLQRATKKQAKNSMRMVFLNFEDFKEHDINERDSKN